MTLVAVLLPLLTATQEGPEPEDVKAGWVAFFIFLALIGAVAVLGFSLTKQLRKAQAAKDAGVYGDDPKSEPGPSGETDAPPGQSR